MVIINRKSHVVDLLQTSSLEAFMHALLSHAFAFLSSWLSCWYHASFCFMQNLYFVAIDV